MIEWLKNLWRQWFGTAPAPQPAQSHITIARRIVLLNDARDYWQAEKKPDQVADIDREIIKLLAMDRDADFIPGVTITNLHI